VLNPDLDVNPITPADSTLLRAFVACWWPHSHMRSESAFESVHVLANGDVVVCEVHDEVALGNLTHSLSVEIWHSDRYKRFARIRHRDGMLMPRLRVENGI